MRYLFDYLKTHKLDHIWEYIARRKQLILRIGGTIAVFIGGFLYIWNVRLPSIIRGVFFLLAVFPLLRMKFMDSSQPTHIKEASASYVRHIWTGMRELLNRKMLPTVLLIFTIQGVTASIFIGGILRPLMIERTGLPIADQSNYLAIVSIPIIFLLFRRFKHRLLSPYGRAILWSVCVIAGFALNIPSHSLVSGLLGITLILFGNYFITPATSVLINKAASSEHRATTLSTASLLSSMPYIVAAPLIGLAADKNELTLVVEILLALMILAVLISIIAHKSYGDREVTI
ncbi:MAG TPA: hypothetical protein VMR34_03530 [Candidatus Saccharimonadales bacterium]|nr:hypothetical protein [Candidatus Saccharimonadales bacterium]